MAAAGTMSPYERAHAYLLTKNGVAVYTEEKQLNAYLVSYGEMHQRKLDSIFNQLVPKQFVDFSHGAISIVDWGCGQGLATLAFLDWMKSHVNGKVKLRGVRLLEMSDVARNRAFEIVLHRCGGNAAKGVIKAVPWREGVPVDLAALDLPANVPVVHLFSNILDVAAVDLGNIAKVVEESKAYGNSLVVAVSPRNYGHLRLEDFWQMLGSPQRIAMAPPYIPMRGALYYKHRENCTAFGYSCLLQGRPMPERPARTHFHYAFNLGSAVDEAFRVYNGRWGRYRYSMDRACAVDQDRVPPVFAVLYNLLLRGNPSRAGLDVESRLASELGLTRQCVTADGGIRFDFTDPQAMRPVLEAVVGKIDPGKPRPELSDEERRYERLVVAPVLAVRIQHAILRTLMSGRVRHEKSVLKILAVEHDVQAAAMAVEELNGHLRHILALASDAYSMPEFRIEVESCRPGGVAALSSRRFDLVLDISFYNDPASRLERISENCDALVRVETANESEPMRGFQFITCENVRYRPLVEKKPDGTFSRLEIASHLRHFLRSVFRKDDFRPGQLPILDRALQAKSVIGLLPTGGGKSLTYQLAGMMQPGIVLVVDPLRSLMKDQYDGLVRSGFTSAAYINSTQTSEEQRQALGRLVDGCVKYVFVSPERLAMPSFRHALRDLAENGLYFSYGVVDEVHCVSEWGHDFRTTYLNIGRNLHRYVRTKQPKLSEEDGDAVVPLFGLTATASFDVLSDVERELSGSGAYELDADAVVRYENTNRLELQYRVVKISNVTDPNANDTPTQRMLHHVERHEAELDDLRRQRQEHPERERGFDTLIRGAANNLDGERRQLRAAVGQAKEQALVAAIREQPNLFRELLKPANIRRIKERYLERESMDRDSATGREVASADLSVDMDVDALMRDADKYTSAGLVFCPYKGFVAGDREQARAPARLSVESVMRALQDGGFPSSALAFFTGSTDDSETDLRILQNQDRFLSNKAGVMVATTAFGMGIDKPNVRFVIEMNHPKSIEAFVQEAGRAGRDHKMAVATLFLSDVPKVDLGVVEFFHKTNFIGQSEEETRIAKFLNAAEMTLQDEEFTDQGRINGFLERLMSLDVGQSMMVVLPFQRNEGDGRDRESEQKIYDKLVYRMSCIGLVDDVENLYGGPHESRRELRLRLVRREDGGYYKCLGKFLRRYFTASRAETETEKAMAMRGRSEIGRCLHYLEDFVYENVQRKRRLAMEDMNAFCREGVAAGSDWLAVNEDLKDFIYYYFNSKYARSGYKTLDGKDFSLLDDTDSGKKDDFSLVQKYMGVSDDGNHDGASPKDNVKHLLGAVRLIARGALEVNPALSLLHAYCLCYLGFHNNPELVSEAIRRLGEEGFGLMLSRHPFSTMDTWKKFRWLKAEFGKRTDLPARTLAGIFAAARAKIHSDLVNAMLDSDNELGGRDA